MPVLLVAGSRRDCVSANGMETAMDQSNSYSLTLRTVEARHDLLLRTGVVITVVVFTFFFSMSNDNSCHSHQHAVIKQSTNSQLPHFVPFTVQERDYLRYGGNETIVDPRDERYLQLIRSHVARPSENKRRLLNTVGQGQSEKLVAQKLGGRRNGFFIECGANDGEFQSNTAYFETHLGWTGLLIEANPALAKILLSRNRQAFVFDGCLSPTRRPQTMKFKSAKCCGGLVDHLSPSMEFLISLHSPRRQQIDVVQCYPLGDLLAALGVSHVDYLSLDVHGAEIPILKTIDFNEIRVDILTVECYEKNETERLQKANEIVKIFDKTGLYKPTEITGGDLLFERIDCCNETSVSS